ncbi:hypothetical protein FOYG_16875 [Fusarium oxysporum NRRL 32931]|uniref:Uncharacterized protein n=1 Tax=Fusarium oxysporum NRRL 32931 TaxID=660029 RepID=W9HCX3_FUSOX|nr:hypothetical protein FOYG_16875 [Fusarium oxysporum NRRL 32931]
MGLCVLHVCTCSNPHRIPLRRILKQRHFLNLLYEISDFFAATAPSMNLSILKKFKDIFRCKDSPVFKGHQVALIIQYLVSPPEPRMRQE